MPEQPFIGQLMPVPYNFAPFGWAFCNGQLLSIQQNSALFSLLGTTYGGNGTTNFALPDLRDRVPLGWGLGPGLSQYDLGELGGSDTVTLQTNQIPSHSHSVAVSTDPASSYSPAAAFPAAADREFYAPAASSTGTFTSTSSGGSQPHNNAQPLLAINWVIALEGVFPARN